MLLSATLLLTYLIIHITRIPAVLNADPGRFNTDPDRFNADPGRFNEDLYLDF